MESRLTTACNKEKAPGHLTDSDNSFDEIQQANSHKRVYNCILNTHI